MDYTVKAHEKGARMQITLTDRKGPIPLSGATVYFQMRRAVGTKAVRGACVVLDPLLAEVPPSTVEYRWATLDLDTPGIYRGEVEIIYNEGTPDERTRTVPRDDYLEVEILADLG